MSGIVSIQIALGRKKLSHPYLGTFKYVNDSDFRMIINQIILFGILVFKKINTGSKNIRMPQSQYANN